MVFVIGKNKKMKSNNIKSSNPTILSYQLM